MDSEGRQPRVASIPIGQETGGVASTRHRDGSPTSSPASPLSPLASAGVEIGRPIARPSAHGKFLFADGAKLYVRGVTYGTFSPDAHGNEFPELDVVNRDFAQIAASGLNAVRVFTPLPQSLLDLAYSHGLRVMIGLAAERYIGYLIDKKKSLDIETLMRTRVRSYSDHPAILCYALGNEIPASIVRWLGRSRVERFLERLYRAIKTEDPDSLVTYVSYPSTEYLQLPFLDFTCFNVYLESQQQLETYLEHVQNVAGERPLILGEIGLDSRRNGDEAQAQLLDWQIRSAFAAGCAGAFVFGWTDEWHTGGADVEDWAFGLTTRDRRPKPALAAVREAFRGVPFPTHLNWPRVSVVVCSRNGERTLRDCFKALLSLEYPDFEVIVVDDGSSDGTAALARSYGFQVISTGGLGLGRARNAGLDAASGEVVAYIDDDAYPDPHWLTYLAATLLRTCHAGVGGPNIAPPDDGFVAGCVANAPGGPAHVLLSDAEAEHVPGCNFAFRKDALRAIGGFDPQFRIAGDDVDVCWRLRERGWTLGFSPAAVVWHHRRSSVRAYWRQQRHYGEAEALLERKWPEKHNVGGHVRWSGRVYGTSQVARIRARRGRIYHGTWGSAAFQPLYHDGSRVAWTLPALPDWYLAIAALAVLSALGMLWAPLFLFSPLLGLAVLASVAYAWLSAAPPSGVVEPRFSAKRVRVRSLTAFLHLLQPTARLWGRLRGAGAPFRRHGRTRVSLPRRRTSAIWSERRQATDERLASIESSLHRRGLTVLRGGPHDRWDLDVRAGLLGSARVLMGLEDHPLGAQLIRFRWWPRCSAAALLPSIPAVALTVAAGLDAAWIACGLFAAVPVALAVLAVQSCTVAMGAIADAIGSQT